MQRPTSDKKKRRQCAGVGRRIVSVCNRVCCSGVSVRGVRVHLLWTRSLRRLPLLPVYLPLPPSPAWGTSCRSPSLPLQEGGDHGDDLRWRVCHGEVFQGGNGNFFLLLSFRFLLASSPLHSFPHYPYSSFPAFGEPTCRSVDRVRRLASGCQSLRLARGG